MERFDGSDRSDGFVFTHEATPSTLGVPKVKYCIDESKYLLGGFWPTQGTVDSAGRDFAIPFDVTIEPHSVSTIWTPIRCEIPKGYYGFMTARSSTLKKNCTVSGTIDSDYRGHIHIIVSNHNDQAVHFKAGSAIAQMIIVKILEQDTCEFVTDVNELSKTSRGEQRFGSTSQQN